jgi:CubicO group peptidase (beta-lactamase class C family)
MNPVSSFVWRRRFAALAFLCLAACVGSPCLAASAETAAPLPVGSAPALGFAPDRLDRLHASLRQFVDDGRCSGFVTLLVRHGEIADWRAYGYRDLETRAPMERDTIVRLYSNSKLIVSVGAMMLFEEGRLDLNAPVEKYLPELKARKVLVGGTVDVPELVDAKTAPTIRELLSHTAGFAYDFGGTDTLSQLYRRADMWHSSSTLDFVHRIAALPLGHQPGTEFRYGVNTDLLGAIIERISGQTLEEFLQQRIFQPLKMPDTSFGVVPEKRARLAKAYRPGKDGQLAESPAGAAASPDLSHGLQSGGGGLFSTAGDYARFAQMLLNGGELDGVRLLGRRTVDYMTLNHLVRTSKPTHAYSSSRGFGLGPEVVIDPAKDPNLCSAGQFGWYGIASTFCQVDPSEDLVAIAFFQHQPMNQHDMFGRFANGYNTALVEPPATEPEPN